MEEENKNHSFEDKDKNKEEHLCSACGFPTKTGDTACMYCNHLLATQYKPSIKEKISLYKKQRQWKKRKKKKLYSYKNGPHRSGMFIKQIGMTLIGTVLTFTGLAIFLSGVMGHDIKAWMISLFFLLYGIFTLIYTWKK